MKGACCLLFSFIFLWSSTTLAHGKRVTISNTQPRTDIYGNIMDVHDGSIVRVDGTYYWFAASYGDCQEEPGVAGCNASYPQACGFQTNHTVVLHTSTDMKHWTPHGVVWNATWHPYDIVMYCPKVIRHKAFGYYVLWYNWVLYANNTIHWDQSAYAVALSYSPFGPFQLMNANISVSNPDSGDFGLYADDDGIAYIVYTTNLTLPGSSGHRLVVEQLSSSYLSSNGANYTSSPDDFPLGYEEAPIMFKRNKTYYVMTGPCCCFCSNPEPVIAYSSHNPLGPFKLAATNLSTVSQAQETFVVEVETANGEITYLWQGDRWQQAPDHLKSHDPQYWTPMKFNSTGGIEQFVYLPNFTLDMP
eukprot:PhF_6_TR20495/c0_g1_i1/m.29524